MNFRGFWWNKHPQIAEWLRKIIRKTKFTQISWDFESNDPCISLGDVKVRVRVTEMINCFYFYWILFPQLYRSSTSWLCFLFSTTYIQTTCVLQTLILSFHRRLQYNRFDDARGVFLWSQYILPTVSWIYPRSVQPLERAFVPVFSNHLAKRMSYFPFAPKTSLSSLF